MKILFAGTPTNAATVLEALVAAGHEVVSVLTREDSAVGRKRELKPSAVAEAAEKLGLETIKANRVDANVLRTIAGTGAEIAVVVAYGALLDDSAISAIPKGWINLHFSLLPDWRGAAPAQRAILSGDRITGVTVFQIDEGLDTGPIWGQVQTEIQPGENSKDLVERLTKLGVSLLLETLPKIEANLFTAVKQTGTGRIAKKLSRTEAELDFQQTAIELELAIRAFNPEPIAYCKLAGEDFRILDARALGKTDWSALDDSDSEATGTILTEKKRVLVRCGQGTLLELKQVQPAGKKPMSAIDWSRGAKVLRFD